MRLAKAEFWGFGRLAQAKVNLDHKVVAIVGPNEAGKTTLLRALAYINNGESLTAAQRSRGLGQDVPDNADVVRVQFRLDDADRDAVSHLDLDEMPSELWLSRTAGPGEIGRQVLPPPRKNLNTLAVGLEAVKSTATDAAFAELEPAEPAEGEEVDERRASFAERLMVALDTIEDGEGDDGESLSADHRLGDLDPATWIAEFDDHGLGGPIRAALEQVQEWLDREDPGEEAAEILYGRSPDILMFSEEDRLLASSYELTEEIVRTPPAALRNLSTIANLSLDELWKTINNGDEGARETLIEGANQTLQSAFEETWNQSNIAAHLKINGMSLEVRIRQDGLTITQFHERSAGVQMFVALVAFLTVQGQTVPPVLLIDEAETHLHIDAQADLVNEFMTQTRAAKIIYTTHSPACLPPDLGTNVRAVVPDPENGQRSLVEGSFWRNSAGFSPLMLAMGAGAAAFSAARRVVLAEGATEMLLLPTLIKQSIGVADLSYQVAPGLSEVPASMYPELDLEGARVAFLVDGDVAGSRLRSELLDAGVPEGRIVSLGALTLENLLDSDLYKDAIVRLINEIDPAAEVSVGDLPELPLDDAAMWPTVIQAWADERGHAIPGKRVIASRLVEDGLAAPSERGVEALAELHRALTAALGSG